MMLSLLFLTSQLISSAVAYNEATELQRRPFRSPGQSRERLLYHRESTIRGSRISLTSHSQKLACDSCHKFPTKNWKEVRKGDAAFPDVAEFPEHSSCLNCHRQQFFARERPAPAICSNCHVNVTPRDTTRFLFPSLGDMANSSKPWRDVATEFAINFPHETHVDLVEAKAPAPNHWHRFSNCLVATETVPKDQANRRANRRVVLSVIRPISRRVIQMKNT